MGPSPLSDTPAPGSNNLAVAGERRLRQFLFVLNLFIVMGIGGAAAYVWFYRPDGITVYFALQQKATLTYLFIWLSVAVLGAISAPFRRTKGLAAALTLLLTMEGGAHAYFYFSTGKAYHPWAQEILTRFEPHPLLIGVPRPGRFGELSHDDMHRRTTINENKAADARLIYLFGGSSTYDVGVVDSQTWASDLSRMLGPSYVVQNYGVPGFSSLESMIQSLFVFRDQKPVCAVYYEGPNDLQNSHIENLRVDYTDYQQVIQYGILSVNYQPGLVEENFLLLHMIHRWIRGGDGHQPQIRGQVSDTKDPRLSEIYTKNLELIAQIDAHFGVKTVFVPHVLNYDWLETHYKGWWPYIPAKGVRPLMAAMNEDLQRVAHETGALFLAAALAVDWQESDFVDQAHFTAAGSAKLAAALADPLRDYCQ